MRYEVWIEGYLATGMEGVPQKARLLGTFEADSFRHACVQWAITNKETNLFNIEALSYWGCRMFDNEEEARKSFG